MRAPRIGLLYPTPDTGEDDFAALAARVTPRIDLDIVYMPWPDGVGDLRDLETEATYDAVRRLGGEAHLRAVVPEALAAHDPIDAVAFGVSSASFLHGTDGVTAQVHTLSEVTGVPATSTTAAFLEALRHLRLRRVALASVYHPSGSDHFVDRVRESGTQVVHRVDADAPSDHDLAAWTPDQITGLVRAAAHPDAQAVLLPETALHTSPLTSRLAAAAGVPVLTATGVTVWAACRLLGLIPSADDAGPLFA
ncbi:maleate cis-trans isomerase family protein [Actinomadura violacea]|uniref:Maleate cis-trans isomerase n=1 Tax=Actinomadura violacea TaxID=2819934 RepID=A0ABS3S6P6_9ACTN|nr:hypothetical protein [Actinomadura violacea]MBO2463929.1 hypothetical protein [Actinomadura violacea]